MASFGVVNSVIIHQSSGSLANH